ncbi:uncharacterized protein LOC143446088 [Clavelina lepadiformis]|uniref:uncharacterized protein LOC143446088 n=1 Tax=Clavelina lepadiformis TaxID=159417 RepID=UPI00404390C1
MAFVFYLTALYSLSQFVVAQPSTTVKTISTTTRPIQCLNGGSCDVESTGVCARCSCALGYSGLFCEVTLLRLDGNITYRNENSQNTTSTNITAVNDMIRSTSASVREVGSSVDQQDATNIRIFFSIYLDRPSPPINSTAQAKYFNDAVQRIFSTDASIEAIFGPGSKVQFVGTVVDVNECSSDLDDCSPQAQCIETVPGFRCACLEGYKGKGRICEVITCRLYDMPSTPVLGTRTITLPDGRVVTNPSNELPYKTTIEFGCQRYYELLDPSTGEAAVPVVECGLEGWSASDVSCGMELGFRVALGASAVSSFIIISIIACFVTDYCVKKEKKAKARENDDQVELSFETVDHN